MLRVRTRLAAAVLFVVVSSLHVAADDTLPDTATLAAKRTVIELWLSESKIDKQLEVVKLRSSQHPDPAAEDRRAVRLELLFRAGPERDGKVDDEFRAFMTAQSEASGQPFANRCLYKVAHLLELSRNDVSVHFNVAEAEYVVFFDSATRTVVTQRVPRRGSIRRTLTFQPPARTTQTTKVSVAANKQMAQSIRSFFEQAWRGISTDGVAAEVVFEPLEPDYVAFAAAGFKRQIIRSHDYWERLQVSMELSSSADGWKLTCYFDGGYASGLGRRKPAEEAYSDMDAAFRADLNTYATSVLSRLQQYLERQ